MFETIYGPITNVTTGETRDIMVECRPNTLKDLAIGGSLIVLGVTYIAVKAFKNGSKAFEIAEFDTMYSL